MFKMEKHNQRQDSNLQFNRNVPGCFWSLIHTLDYHPWHNVKKMIPYRKHSRSKRSPKTTLNNHQVPKEPEQFNEENKTLKSSTEVVHADERSEKASASILATEEMSEVESQRFWKPKFNSNRGLYRMYSIHHLEPSHYSPGNTKDDVDPSVSPNVLAASGEMSNSPYTMDNDDCSGQKKIVIKSMSFSKNSNEVKESSEANSIDRDTYSHSSKKDVDILEVFKENKKLFAELLQGADDKHLQGQQSSKTKVGLAKSRSFPAGLSRNKIPKLSSLQHKQSDYFPKGQKSVSDPLPSKLVESSESPKNSYQISTPYESASTSFHKTGQKTSPSLDPNHGLRHGGWNQLVLKRFGLIKTKLSHAFREKKKRNNQILGIETSSGVTSGHELSLEINKAPEGLGVTASRDGSGRNMTDSFESDKISERVQRTKRIASINASLEKYTQLFEISLNRTREAKCHHSQSLKKTGQDRILRIENARKSFNRNLSLPDIDLFCTLFNDPQPKNDHTAPEIKALVDPNIDDNDNNSDPSSVNLLAIDKSESLDGESQNAIEKGEDNMTIENSGCLDLVENDDENAWSDEHTNKTTDLDAFDREHQRVLGTEWISNDVEDISQHSQILDIDACFEDDSTFSLEFHDSKGVELNLECDIVNELEPYDDLPDKLSTETLPSFETIINQDVIDDAEKISNYLYLHSESNSINNANFNYMRYILQLTSFIDSDNSIDHPPNSTLFNGLETRFYKKLELYWKKVDKDSDHQLLLDLVHETLHNAFERPFVSLLKAFSLKSHIHPMPLGQYLLEEVREKVAWYLCLGPELDQSLDDVVGRDFRKGDEWMNLQSETECITLDLEDLILDELLDEVLFC